MRRLTIAPPCSSTQPELLTVRRDKVFDTAGAARGHNGHVVEQVVTECLGLTPIPIDGRFDVCFDAVRCGVFFEVKSVRANGKAPIYVFRVNKELRSGVPVLYVFAEHHGRGLTSFADLYAKVVPSIRHLYVVTLAEVKLLSDVEPLHLTTDCRRNGYTRVGYRDGYKNVPMRGVRRVARHPLGVRTGSVDGIACRVHLHASTRARPILQGVVS